MAHKRVEDPPPFDKCSDSFGFFAVKKILGTGKGLGKGPATFLKQNRVFFALRIWDLVLQLPAPNTRFLTSPRAEFDPVLSELRI